MSLDEFYDEDWKELRLERLDYDQNLCDDCGDKATQVHHLRYPAEDIEDCVSLCNNCHLDRHGKHEWDNER